MKVVDRYVGMAAVTGTGLSMLALALIDGLFAFVGEIPDIGRVDYGPLQAMSFVLLTMPRRIYDLFPTAALLGALLGVGALAVNSELVAIRSAGVSRRRISAAVIGACVLLLVPVMLMGEWVAPASEQAAQQLRITHQARDVSVGGASGLWVRQGDLVVNAGRLLESGALSDVTVYEFGPERRLVAVSRASLAQPVDDGWALTRLRRTEFSEGGSHTERFRKVTWPELVDPALLRVAALNPKDLSLRSLSHFVTYLRDNGINAYRYEQAYWSKIFFPLTVVALVIAGLPFVFGPLRQGGFGQRLFVGIVIGLLFFLFNRLLERFGAVYHLDPVALALVPPLLVILAAGLYLRRTFA